MILRSSKRGGQNTAYGFGATWLIVLRKPPVIKGGEHLILHPNADHRPGLRGPVDFRVIAN